MAKGVRNTHHEYDEYLPVWQRCEDAVSGQRAVQSAGVRYLPMLTGEKLPDYQARVMRSDYFNATWRTIAGLSGMAFRKAVTTNLPAAIEPFLKNIDLAGTDMTTMAKLLVEDVLEVGRIGLLVDHPPMPENVVAMTVAFGAVLGVSVYGLSQADVLLFGVAACVVAAVGAVVGGHVDDRVGSKPVIVTSLISTMKMFIRRCLWLRCCGPRGSGRRSPRPRRACGPVGRWRRRRES